MSPTDTSEPEQQAGLRRAFQLVHDVQAGRPGASEAIAALTAEAVRQSWDKVLRATMFAEVIANWCQGVTDGVDGKVAALVEASEHAGDEVMLACGLALRAGAGPSAPGSSAADGATDLARAVVLLEEGSGSLLGRITGHTACGIALSNRWLFELGQEQYEAALALGEGRNSEDLGFILAPVVFDLAELQVSWASVLRQLGNPLAVAARWMAWRAALSTAARFAMPEQWQRELDALGLLLAATAGKDVAGEAGRLLGTCRTSGVPGRSEGLLWLSIALCDLEAGRAGARSAVTAAIEGIDPQVHPHACDLALWVAAQLEEPTGESAALRYARRHLEAHWADRLASLDAMRARIRAERLGAERELLLRHALLDDLTGVGNRRALDQHLDRLVHDGVERVAFILLDVDRFKKVNDQRGHHVGDAVLVGIGQVLRQCVRPGDLAVRLGGDEFAIVLADTSLAVANERAAELIARCDGLSFDAVSPGLVLTLSAGVAAGPPTDAVHLRQEADAALYRAKAGYGEQILRSRLAHTGV